MKMKNFKIGDVVYITDTLTIIKITPTISTREKFDPNTGKHHFKPIQAVITDIKDPGHIGIVILPDKPYDNIKDIIDSLSSNPTWFLIPDVILTTTEIREYKLNQLDI